MGNNVGKDVRDLIFKLLDGTHTALPGTINSFDDSNLRAEVQLLEKDEEGRAPVLVDVPVMVLRANGLALVPPYAEGDVVLVVFSESDLQGPLYDGKPREAEFKGRHELDNGIVIGGLIAATENISLGGSSSSYRLGTEDGKSTLELTEDGNFNINTDSGTVNINSSDTVNVKSDSEINLDSDSVSIGSGNFQNLIQSTVQTAINSHAHTGVTTGTGTSGTPDNTLITPDDITEDTEAG